MITAARTIVRSIPAKDLKIHPTAQRALVPTKLKQIEKSFDLDAIGTLHAVEYSIDGVFGTWLVDGQHRATLLMSQGLGDWEVSVMVHTDVKTDAQASRLFLRLNDRSVVGGYDKYLNELRSGASAVSSMTKIVEARGLRIDRYNGGRAISAITSLRAAWALDAGQSLALALKIIEDAWSFKGASLEGKLIEGLSVFLARNNRNNLDISGFTKRLSKQIPAQIIAFARVNCKSMRQSLARQFVCDLTQIYNTKRSTGTISVDASSARVAPTPATPTSFTQ